MVERAHLTDALALAAQPRQREYAIHNATLRGFMRGCSRAARDPGCSASDATASRAASCWARWGH